MKNTRCIIDKDFVISEIDDNIYGSFIEHLGRAVYEGIYEPDHPTADEDGFRKDVLELINQLFVPIVRYPGGNFVSSYDWTDGIGPKEERPRKLDLAWKSFETNQVGINEFADWAKKANTEIMAAVNLGTGTPMEAGNMLEYCNFPSGSYWSDLRIKHGYKEPHNIKVWCLGNEMDGPWQICRLTAEEYGLKARETAKIMKIIDPSISLVVCGSSTTLLPSYPVWDRVVLEHTYDYVDYISLHRYYENTGSRENFLASFVNMDDFIHTVTSIADYVKAKNRSKKTMMLSFDEWNVWYQKKQEEKQWALHPHLIEDNYSVLDAVVFGGLMCSLINNSDRVKMASLAQLVNVIAPILTEKSGKAIKQTTFFPFELVSKYGRGTSLKAIVKSETYESEYGETPYIYSSCVYNKENKEVVVFLINNDLENHRVAELDFRSFNTVNPIEHITLFDEDLDAKNTFSYPDRVKPSKVEIANIVDNNLQVTLPKVSFNMIRVKVD